MASSHHLAVAGAAYEPALEGRLETMMKVHVEGAMVARDMHAVMLTGADGAIAGTSDASPRTTRPK
jgi:hypothetical protein